MKPGREKYEGHDIELREHEGQFELRVDGARLRYGLLPGGLYYLHDYAYDWTDDLIRSLFWTLQRAPIP